MLSWIIFTLFIQQISCFLPDKVNLRSSYSRFVYGKERLASRCRLSEQSHLDRLQSLAEGKKFIAVTGGVISGIGKGITASSIGVVLKALQVQPTAIKIDPYLNVDAGTMSPTEHGEVFVLDDGSETDLDLGNYERFLDVRLTNDSNLTTGKIYQEVILKERRGDYLGKTVQIIPHITNEILERIIAVAQKPIDSDSAIPEVVVIELGGTIGDIESMPFVEALRQLRLLVKPENFCLVHISMVPTVGEDGEQKTKPTQHSVKELRSLGLIPDFIVCRSKLPLYPSSLEKIGLFCNVPNEHVISIHDVSNTYKVPLLLLKQNFHRLLRERLQLKAFRAETVEVSLLKEEFSMNPLPTTLATLPDLQLLNQKFISQWSQLADRMDSSKDIIKVALIAKYVQQSDSYLSIISALKHSCAATDQKLALSIIDSTHLEESYREINEEQYQIAWEKVKTANGILVPGGFGARGIEGKIAAIEYARTKKVPFFGICLGMQLAIIEYCRHVLQLPTATSQEFRDQPQASSDQIDSDPIIFMPEIDPRTMGGTMRLGARKTLIATDSLASQLYQKDKVLERHRHRYEVNPAFVDRLEKQGLVFSGKDETGERMEIIELLAKDHPFFIATQFHPEYQSRPLIPSPVFLGFVRAIKEMNRNKDENRNKYSID